MNDIDQNTEILTQDYTILNHWAAKNAFFRIETSFLHRLLDDHIAHCPETDQVKKFRQVKLDLRQLEAHELHIEAVLKQQMENLSAMVKGEFNVIEDDLAAKQEQLKKLMAGLTLEYRDFKQQLFALSKEEMKKRV
ncbi:MAG: hypothetical protein JWQ66_3703 [Mucilaginibacter sp.]|nr:hypothetical protein [Mucilaginibacter sp.]